MINNYANISNLMGQVGDVVGVPTYQGTKPSLFSLIAFKSSQVTSFRDGLPHPVALYSDNAVLKLANS